MAKNYLGIDLGTTESTVSVIELETRKDKPMEKLRTLDIYQYNKQHQLDKNLKGLQSSIYIDRKNRVVYTGEYAKELYSSGNMPLHTIRSIKTRIGGESMIEVPLSSNGLIDKVTSLFKSSDDSKSYNMTELSATLLKTIKNSVDKQCSGGLKNVTITIPAGFDSDERNATIEAGKMAGFKEIHLLDEPTAVLLNLLNSEDSLTDISDDFFYKQRNIVVYDIGGGTLDISVASVEDSGDFEVEVMGRSKRMEFGGDDIDKYIASYFLEEFEKINPSIDERTLEDQAKIISRIVSHAQKHKVEFNKKIEKVLDNERRRERVRETINFEIIDNLKIADLTITDKLLKDILSPIISDNGILINPLDKVLKSCKLKKNEIDLVVLTGGSAKFYLVSEVIEKYFQGVNIIDFTEYNAVSKGASIHSLNQDKEDLKKIQIQDIMSDSIYIKRKKGFDELISHNQQLNSKGTYSFIFEDVLDRLELFLYYGSSTDDKWRYREISGVFYKLDRIYKTGETITLNWEFDENKILKIFYDGNELVSSMNNRKQSSELLDSFELKG